MAFVVYAIGVFSYNLYGYFLAMGVWNKKMMNDYRKSRCKSGHKEHLSSFKGTIQCDGAAEYALGEIANWYAQERKYRENGLSPEEKLLRRQVDIKPGFDAFKEWPTSHDRTLL